MVTTRLLAGIAAAAVIGASLGATAQGATQPEATDAPAAAQSPVATAATEPADAPEAATADTAAYESTGAAEVTPTDADPGTAEAPAPDLPAAAEEPAGDRVVVSERGNVVKAVGEPAGLTGPDGVPAFELTVTGIAVAGSCPGRGVSVPPENGHFVVVDVLAAVAEGRGGFMPLGAETFGVVGPDGVTEAGTATTASWGCFEMSQLLPPFVGPGERGAGKVVLDTAHTSGTLVYRPLVADWWEWEFGG